jgi:hypothetical protein
MNSAFMEKGVKPAAADLKLALGVTYEYWKSLEKFARKSVPEASEEWSYSSAKYGWSYRIKDKKRVLIYLLPRDGFFTASMVFGQQATDKILNSEVSGNIKDQLRDARVYAEGRGLRLDVHDDTLIKEIEKLILAKISA